MTHLGDITKIDWFHVPPVDVVTGGSPCQDLSVAGKRAGLAGERSGLYMEQIRCVKELRKADERRGRTAQFIRPRYMVWENVPGAFSSNKGEDFRAVLEEAVRVVDPSADVPRPEKGKWSYSGAILGDGYSVAWRVHDAQFWGVPQRRRRISVVCDFGGQSAPEVLFERKGVSRDSEPGTETGKATAGAAGSGTEGAVALHINASNELRVSDVAYTVSTNGNATGRNTPLLFERKGLSGDFEPGGTQREETAGGTRAGTEGAISFQERAGKPGGGKGILIQNEKTGSLSTLNNQSGFCLQGNGIDRADTAGCNGRGWCEDVSYTLNTIDRSAVCYSFDSLASNSMKSKNPNSGCRQVEVAKTLDCFDPNPSKNQGGIAVVQKPSVDAVCVGNGQLNQMSMAEQANTLDTMHDQQAVMVLNDQGGSVMDVSHDSTATLRAQSHGHEPAVMISAVDCRNLNEHQEVSGTLQCKQNGGYSLNYQNHIMVQGAYYGHSIVRRLTPLEAERLQGYPDGWTDIGEWVDSKGKRHKDADSPRYKALGNSIALPFWFWLLRRISAQYIGPATLGSLFDGIGGFPLCWERCNGNGTALWASEIEEFPMAVTRRHFGEEETM